MRTLSFENLRRLVGRRKDRDEPSFERSESFKRISIRKSYLDRGKRRTRLQKSATDGLPEVAAAPVQVVQVEVSPRGKAVIGPTIVQVRPGSDVLDDKQAIIREEVVLGIKEEEDYDDDEKKRGPAGTIIYGQWLNDADSSYSSKDRKCGLDSYSSRDSKFDSSYKDKIYITQENRPFSKRNYNLPATRKINNDEVAYNNKRVSSVLIEMDKSPQLPRSQSRIQERDETDSPEDRSFKSSQKDCTCSDNVTTVNVGSHDWRDSTSPAGRTYSLSSNQESTLDDRSNDRSIVSRTVSAPDKPTVVGKTDTTSTKASGFSLSLSFSRLTTDIRAAAVTTKNGLFRRRKRTSPMKPSPSVSAEGYFERTAGAGTVVSSMRRSRRSAAGSARRRPGYASRRRKPVANKPPPARDESPVWFVPPERRRSNRQRGRVWREVRYLPQSDEAGDNQVDAKSNDSSNLSDEFDDKKLLLSGDFEEKPPPPRAQDSSQDSSSLISSAASCLYLKPKISDFNEDKIFYEEYRGDIKSKPSQPLECNYFASSQFLGFVAGNSSRRRDSSSSESTESEEQQQRRVVLVVGGKKDAAGVGQIKERRNCSVVLVLEGQTSRVITRQEPGPKRRPLRRKSQVMRKNNPLPGNNPRQPVYLARKRSSLRRRPCSKTLFLFIQPNTK